MNGAVTICFIYLMVATFSVYGDRNCTSKAQPSMVNAELTNPDFIFDFDAVPTDWKGTVPLNVTAGPLVITLQGTEQCGVFNDFGLGGGYDWISGGYWYPNGSALGYFLGLNEASDVVCEIIFSEAITKFSLRVASDIGKEAGLFVYDEADQELNCDLIPWVTVTENNAYSVRGFNSTSKNIKKIVIKDSYATADLLSFNRCHEGLELKDGQCRITCATSGDQCNTRATCSDLTSEPFISCTCTEGYSGTGFGADGCVANLPSSPVASPKATTSGSDNGYGLNIIFMVVTLLATIYKDELNR